MLGYLAQVDPASGVSNGTPEVVNITAARDPCGFVFSDANKASGGTALEWIQYRLCEAAQLVNNVVGTIGDELRLTWQFLQMRWQQLGGWYQAQVQQLRDVFGPNSWIQQQLRQLAQAVEDLIAAAANLPGNIAKIGPYVLVGGLVIVGLWLTSGKR